jgi:capsular polysaccharide export protein
MIAVFSRGIRRIPHLEAFLGEPVVYRPRRASPELTKVVGWGSKPTAERARRFAARHELPYVALEDGFLRSFDLGVRGAPPLSVVIDEVGVYYDATRTSRLEQLLNDGGDGLVAAMLDADRAIALIREHRLSKYNIAPDTAPLPEDARRKVLVVDQTRGDISVVLGMADEISFARMLAAARAENPGARIYVKLHPDVLAGKKRGYLEQVREDDDTVVLAHDVNPLSLIEAMDRVYVVSSQLGFEAMLCGKPVVCFGMPFYAGWGATDDRVTCERRRARRNAREIFAAAYLLYARYVHPEQGARGTIFDVIDHLALQRRIARENAGELFCFGFQLWKRHYVLPFLKTPSNRVVFARTLAMALRKGMSRDSRVLAWGMDEPKAVQDWADRERIPIWRVEDGFIRSVGLGSDLIRPLSLVVDRQGVYFDPSRPSELETLLNTLVLGPEMRRRVRDLIELILDQRVTKYNTEAHQALRLGSGSGQMVIFVPGQVEDDASIRMGCKGLSTNEELLRTVRREHPSAFIVYKPHPDALARNRRGYITGERLRRLCDHVETEVDVIGCIDAVREVHTMTSLAGFDALLRGRKVVTYGRPFYAGWGLTEDRLDFPRRTRRLTLEELVAGTLLHYPRYWRPDLGAFVSAESVVRLIADTRARIDRLDPRRGANLLRPSYAMRQIRKARRLITGWVKGCISTN